MDPRASLTGLLVGILVGMTGMGAGSLMAPLLIMVLHYKAKFAIGSDLAYAAVMKLFGAWQHRRAGNVDTEASAGSWRWAACRRRCWASGGHTRWSSGWARRRNRFCCTFWAGH